MSLSINSKHEFNQYRLRNPFEVSFVTQRFQILPLYAFEYPSHKILPFCYSELTLAAVGESYEHLQTESALFVYLWVSMMFLDEQIKADGIYFHFFPYLFITVIIKRILTGKHKRDISIKLL